MRLDHLLSKEEKVKVVLLLSYREIAKGISGGDALKAVSYTHLDVYKRQLHGPVLPKNPDLCDYILKKALERKYGSAELLPLDDTQEHEANDYIVKRYEDKVQNIKEEILRRI